MTSARAVPLETLLAGLRDDGGFAERTGGAFRPDATAWAALALAGETGDGRSIAVRACGRLASAQQPDGSVPVSPGHPEASWPTALALLAWQASGVQEEAARRAVGFLLSLEGLRSERRDYPHAGHDVSLAGWPWTAGAYPWVVPTALAVVALRRAGRGADPRVTEGIRLLHDRRLSGGGWNSGNTTVFGTELLPQLDTTGAALTALAGATDPAAAAGGISLLERELPTLATPVSLSWAIIALARWARKPAAGALVERSIALEGRYYGYGTTARAMLAVAADGGRVFAA